MDADDPFGGSKTAVHFGEKSLISYVALLTHYITCLRGAIQTVRKGNMSSVLVLIYAGCGLHINL